MGKTAKWANDGLYARLLVCKIYLNNSCFNLTYSYDKINVVFLPHTLVIGAVWCKYGADLSIVIGDAG